MWREVGNRLDGATGAEKLFYLVLRVATILGVERRKIVVVGAPRRIDGEHHVRLGLQRAIAEAAESLQTVLLRGQIFHKNEIGLPGEPFGAADAIKGLGDTRPERGGFFAGGEGDAVKTPRK